MAKDILRPEDPDRRPPRTSERSATDFKSETLECADLMKAALIAAAHPENVIPLRQTPNVGIVASEVEREQLQTAPTQPAIPLNATVERPQLTQDQYLDALAA